MAKKIQLTKEEVKAIKQRMNKLKKANNNNKSSTQNALPFLAIFPDGTCQITKNKFSQTIEFNDCNYELATYEDKDNIFSDWCDIHNYFDDQIQFQFSYENQIVDKKDLIEEIKIPEKDDDFNGLRKEYSDLRVRHLIGDNNGKDIKKYLTYSCQAKNLAKARTILNKIQEELIKLFVQLKVDAHLLDGKERLEALYHSLNPYDKSKFVFDWNLKTKSGCSVKDFIAPISLKFRKNDFEINNCYGSCQTINLLASELSDRVLMDYLKDFDGLVSINIHINPIDQVKALKLIKTKLTDVEKMKIDEQKKATRSGYDPDILPPNIKLYLEELNEMLEDLNAKNERLFNVTITIRNYSQTKKEFALSSENLKRITQKNSCKLIPLDYLQEQAFGSSLILGHNTVPVVRTLQTSATAVFIPFATQELFQLGGQYYGINPISENMILGNRKKLSNPNGLFLGPPGTGKSFMVKFEMTGVFLTTDDDIIIIDPEGEYYPLVNYFDGQVVKISSNSSNNQYLNPMDVPLYYDNDDNPIADQSDFIVSLCEIIVSDRTGLTSEEKTAIDKCVRRIYNKFYDDNPTLDKMPILQDLLDELRKPDVIEIASRVANSLEMYVSGSQNLFNHQTNIDINNRLVCFDIRNLGTQLKKVAMLIIQNQIWNRVSTNRNQLKSTWFYIDEFHLLLRDKQTAEYSVEIWKRFRKWGGIPSGITQNIKDLLASPEIENIFETSDFVFMTSQASGDREILQYKLQLSDAQVQHIKNNSIGRGLLKFGNTVLPYENIVPENTLLFKLLNTDPEKKEKTSVEE